MTDPSPLLTPRDQSDDYHGDLCEARSLDEAIERYVGSFGPAHLLQAVIVSFAWVFDAQQTFINVFTDRQPSWRCRDASDSVCSTANSPCGLPRAAWEWDIPPQGSVVSEWDLTCAGPVVAGLPASSFYVGCLVGGFLLASLADSSLGRKKMLLLSCTLMSLVATFTVFSPNVWVYSLLRFVAGFGRATIGTCTLVLSTELVGKRWRGQVGILSFFFFSFGFLSLPWMAYSSGGASWRRLYLCTSLPALVYCIIVHLLVHESPRWLFVKGHKDRAIQTLDKIATFNGKELNHEHFSKIRVDQEEALDGGSLNMYSAMKILYERKWAFRRLSAAMAIGIGVGLVYYGMPLAVGSLNFNVYLSVTFNALAELPSALITLFLIGQLSRRGMVLAFAFTSAVSSITCSFVHGGDGWRRWAQMGLEVVSFFSACTTLNVVLIYTLELFPTCVRNSALSMVRQAVVLGGVFGPVVVAAWRQSALPFGVFGAVIGVCGLFVVCLPETKGAAFCDTMEEQEQKDNSPATNDGKA